MTFFHDDWVSSYIIVHAFCIVASLFLVVITSEERRYESLAGIEPWRFNVDEISLRLRIGTMTRAFAIASRSSIGSFWIREERYRSRSPPAMFHPRPRFITRRRGTGDVFAERRRGEGGRGGAPILPTTKGKTGREIDIRRLPDIHKCGKVLQRGGQTGGGGRRGDAGSRRRTAPPSRERERVRAREKSTFFRRSIRGEPSGDRVSEG